MSNRSLITRVAQLNPTVGALPANMNRALEVMREAESDGVDLLVFPEMFIVGYPAQDLILEKDFILECQAHIENLAKHSGSTVTLIGSIHYDGVDTYNAAAILQNGELKDWVHKSLLPTYDVFDEWRYFKPGRDNQVRTITFRNGLTLRLGIHICEDLWDEKIDYKICDILGDAGVDLFVNLSASPFNNGKGKERSRLILNKVRKYNKPFIYANIIGGQDQLVFDGQSLICDKTGSWIHIGKQFEEEITTHDIPIDTPCSRPVEMKPREQVEEILDGLILGVRDYFRKTGHSKAVLGLSGGIDSALTACVAVEALGAKNVLGIAMPSKYSSDHSIVDAEELASNLGIDYLNISIGKIFDAFQDTFTEYLGEAATGVTEENLQARIRGNILMTLSNRDGSLLLSTGNKTEIALGYCTLYGDMSGGLAVISDIGKRTVYALSRYYNKMKGKEIIPQNTITKMPSAELRPNQVDPFDYDIIAPLVNSIIEEHADYSTLREKGWDADLIEELQKKIQKNEYKRQQMPPGIRVTAKAFGIGRRMPIVNHYVYKTKNR